MTAVPLAGKPVAVLAATGIVTGSDAPVSLDVPIVGVDVLELYAPNATGTGKDHASWADARVLR